MATENEDNKQPVDDTATRVTELSDETLEAVAGGAPTDEDAQSFPLINKD